MEPGSSDVDSSGAPSRSGCEARLPELSGADADQALLASIVDTCDDAIFSKSLDGIVRSWNRAAESTFGYSFAEIVGKPIGTLLPEDRANEEIQFLETLRQGGRIRSFESVRVRKDGRSIPVSLTISPIRDAEGRMIGASEIARDFTERKAREEALARSERHAKRLADAAPALISYIDADLRYRFVNRQYESWFGRPCDQILGMAMEEVVGEQAFAQLRGYVSEVLAGREVHFEVEAPYNEGTRWIDGHYLPHLDAEGQVVGFYVMVTEITRHKEMEQALRQSEQRIRATFDRAAVGIMEVDGSDRVVAVNDRACKILGYQREELLGMSVLDLTAPEDRAVTTRLHTQLHQGRVETFSYEKRYLKRDGSLLWVHVSVSAVRDSQGRSVRHIGTLEDISEHKRAEEERERLVAKLREVAADSERNRAQLEAVFHAINDGVVIFDMSGAVVLINEAEDGINGYSTAGVIKRDIRHFAEAFELFLPGGPMLPVDQWPAARVLRGESVQDWELRARRRDTGREWFFSFSGEPVRNEEGRQVLAILITRDITERKRGEQALRESEAWHRTITEAMPHLVWSARADGAFDYINSKWTSYTGLSLPRSEGAGWMQAVHPDDVERVERLWRAAVELGSEFDCDYRLVSKEGSYRWFKSWGVPLRNAGGQITNWFGACTDIDDAVKAREVLARARDDLERTVQERTARLQEMVAELETFSYSIAHDMRGPLRAMQGFAEAVLDDYGEKLGPEGRDFLERIKAGAARQDHFIRDVLKYSRVVRQDLRLEPVNLDRLVEGVISEYPDLQQARAHIEVRHPLGFVLGHAPSLVQCVSNLLGNALKFVLPGTAPRVRVWSERHNGRLRLVVEDNGLGIEREHQSRLFRLFERLHGQSEYPGTGIGLAIVRKAVERMDGSVGVDSEPGQGSRFWLELKSES